MSFWNDLEEMQKEIENLDTKTVSKSGSGGNSKSSTPAKRVQNLEEKAQSLSKRLSKKHAQKAKSRIAPEFKSKVDLAVEEATTSRDANVQLMQHLGSLEDEISKLGKKEDVWHDTAQVIQNEVQSLRQQINRMKSDQNPVSTSSRYNSTRSNERDSSSRQRERRARNTSRPKQRDARRDVHREHNRSTRAKRAPAVAREPKSQQKKIEVTVKDPDRTGLNITVRSPRHTERTERTERTHSSDGPPAMNMYKYERLQRVNEQLVRDNENLKHDLTQMAEKNGRSDQQLKLRVNELDSQIVNLKHELKNKDYALRDEQARSEDLQHQIQVLQQVVDEYDTLKDSNNKLQLEYQKSLQDVLEARKDKSLVDQQLSAAKNHIQELEINCRQINHERMGALSEMRAMKQVFEQERKNVADRYERIIHKLEAELSYAKKMYQEIKRKYRDLQHHFEMDQPQYENLKKQLEAERDVFQTKLNDVVISHVTNLDMISKQSSNAVENRKWLDDVHVDGNGNDDARAQDNDAQNQSAGGDGQLGGLDGQSAQRPMSSVWVPSDAGTKAPAAAIWEPSSTHDLNDMNII